MIEHRTQEGERIDVGDTVRIRLDSERGWPPAMLVEKLTEFRIHCIWFTESAELRKHAFDPFLLGLLKKGKPEEERKRWDGFNNAQGTS